MKAMFFDFGECPVAAKVAPGRHQTRNYTTKHLKTNAKMEPKWSQNGFKLLGK